MDKDNERPRGVLTTGQRDFLADSLYNELDDELSQKAIRQRWYRIRRSLRHALQDFTLLQSFSLAGISDDMSDTPMGFKKLDAPLDPAVLGVLTFLFNHLGDDVFRAAVEMTIDRETSHQLRRRQKLANINTDVSVSVTDERTADELKERFNAGEQLTDTELVALYYWNRISQAEFKEHSSDSASSVVPRK